MRRLRQIAPPEGVKLRKFKVTMRETVVTCVHVEAQCEESAKETAAEDTHTVDIVDRKAEFEVEELGLLTGQALAKQSDERAKAHTKEKTDGNDEAQVHGLGTGDR